MRPALVFAEGVAWVVAMAWSIRIVEAVRGLPSVANLLLPQYDRSPSEMPTLTVIVPARNEEQDVAACLDSLLSQEYPRMKIIAVNDRSTDATGRIMDDLASGHPDRLRVLHIEKLPAGWLGKTHAMHRATGMADSEYLLFTDADIVFRKDALRRALGYAVETGAAHLVLTPTTVIRRWDEAALLGFFQVFGLWGARPWRIADPDARDAIGIGAFNLVRREAYKETGGFETLRLEIVEDLGLGRLLKRLGMPQRMAFGRDLVNIHWASGAAGLVGVLTKNIFSFFRYSVPFLLFACVWLVVFCMLPFATIFYWPLTVPSLLIVGCIVFGYRLVSPHSGLSAWNALLAPWAGVISIYALLRSMRTTLRQGGVIWRGTFYSLEDLKGAMPPLMEILFPRRRAR